VVRCGVRMHMTLVGDGCRRAARLSRMRCFTNAHRMANQASGASVVRKAKEPELI